MKSKCPRLATLAALMMLVATLALASGGPALASIESKPFRVTHKNSGPRYDIDEVERTRLATADNSENQVLTDNREANSAGSLWQSPQGASSGSDSGSESELVGPVTVRRIVLVPLMPSSAAAGSNIWSTLRGSSFDRQPEQPAEESEPSSQSRTFWPFLAPLGAGRRHHLFGPEIVPRVPPKVPADPRDERPSSGMEPAASDEAPMRPLLDPIQMLLEIMQQALKQGRDGSLSSTTNNFFNDLNKDASGSSPSSGSGKQPAAGGEEPVSSADSKPLGTELERPPIKPTSHNETKEEIVDIEGKKYLKKTIVNRHVGENIVFMTRRLIFMPLNETTNDENGSASTSTAPTPLDVAAKTERPQSEATGAPTTTAAVSTEPVTTVPSSVAPSTERKLDETTTATGTVAPTSTTTTEAAAAPVSSSTTTSAPESSNKEETTPKSSEDIEKSVLEVLQRAAERLRESESVPAQKNNNTN